MIFVPNKLKTIYNKIKECKLVLTKEINDENLIEFQKLINKTIPKHSDYQLYNFIKSLSKNNDKFLSFINEYNIPEIILWAKIEYLLKYFNLDKLIYIGHNYIKQSEKNKRKVLHNYIISKYNNDFNNKKPVNNVVKKMNITSILKRFDEKKDESSKYMSEIQNHSLQQKEDTGVMDMIMNYNNSIESNLINLDIYEENYFNEDSKLWNRRNKLRNESCIN